MGIEPTWDLLSPTLVLKTRGTTRHQSPPQKILFIILMNTIIYNPFRSVNEQSVGTLLLFDIGRAKNTNWPIRLRSGHALKLGLNWVCFHQVSNWIYFHKPFSNSYLRSFGFSGNWVCFA